MGPRIMVARRSTLRETGDTEIIVVALHVGASDANLVYVSLHPTRTSEASGLLGANGLKGVACLAHSRGDVCGANIADVFQPSLIPLDNVLALDDSHVGGG